jgi:uncharacterized protein (DUF1501 family)
MSITRRTFLRASAAFGALAPATHAFGAARDSRLVTIVLRGALDGMAAVAPIGDPAYAGLRGDLALTRANALPLDGFFALHPAMPQFARLYQARQALVVHAAASPYRGRSHFEGQDVLESGQSSVGRADSGWMNRMLQALPSSRNAGREGLAVGALTPLIMRGPAPVLGWAPQSLKAEDDLAQRVLSLYRHADPALGAALAQGLDTNHMALNASKGVEANQGAGQPHAAMVKTAEGAARLLAQDNGPRIAALAFDGWDTHVNESARLAQLLAGLDAALATFEQTLGARWADTAILVVTEFGRTVQINGTGGSDHGTGSVAFLAGGAVKGGRVVADWPGLAQAHLFEGRDLKPTLDLRALAKGLAADHLGLSAKALDDAIFPGSQTVRPLTGLIA